MFKTEVILANFTFFVKVISRKNAAATVARGPVPRDRSNETKNVRSPKDHGRFLVRPRRGEGQALALRFGGTVWIATK